MKQLLPTRTLVRLLGIATVAVACSRSEQADTADSSAAADTAMTASAAPAPAPSPANNTPASLTADYIDRWQKGMNAEL